MWDLAHEDGHMSEGVYQGQRLQIPLVMKLLMAIRHWTWVQGTKLGLLQEQYKPRILTAKVSLQPHKLPYNLKEMLMLMIQCNNSHYM